MAYKDPKIYTYSFICVVEMIEYMFNTKPDIWEDDDKIPKSTRETVGKLIKLRDQMMYRGMLGWFFKKRNRVIAEAIKEIALELELASEAHRGLFSRLEGFVVTDYVTKNEFEAIISRIEILNEKIEQIKSSLNQGV